ncbi:MAG: 3-hydroxyanthranilate 3,4-dioxygenase [Elusimicrobia bacterium]|nr:MAG: 3-hydroxyanthranilate 3,4-dioxygenase [Elusimicrobiota bacterium]
MANFSAFNLKKWIDEHRDVLKPPVCNKQVWKDSEFIVMIIGGPNQRTDFHIDPGEEFFYQLEGDMVLTIFEDGVVKDVPIKEGEVLLLPPNVPHSPQRFENTVGMVVERRRREGEIDHLLWYCGDCREIVHDVEFHLTNIEKQLKPIFDAYYGDEKLRTCGKCGWVEPAKEKAKAA